MLLDEILNLVEELRYLLNLVNNDALPVVLQRSFAQELRPGLVCGKFITF